MQEAWIDELEADCDRYNEELEPLRSFILPGGTPGAAQLHVARTVARRAGAAGFGSAEVVPMPANNLLVVFRAKA